MNAVRRAHHGVSPAEPAGPVGRHLQFMPQRTQFVEDLCRDRGFDADVTALERGLCESPGFKRLLDREIEIRNIRDELGVRLRLIESTHDTETDTHAFLFHKARNNGVQWPLPGHQRVGVIRLESKQRAAIMKRKAHIVRHQP